MKINPDLVSDTINSIVDDKNVKFTQTTNGWNLKFDNGFMMQLKRKKIDIAADKWYGSAVPYGYVVDMGNWDTEFKTILDFRYHVGHIYGSRDLWAGSNGWTTGVGEDIPTTKSAGKGRVFLNWKGACTLDYCVIGYGTWK